MYTKSTAMFLCEVFVINSTWDLYDHPIICVFHLHLEHYLFVVASVLATNVNFLQCSC